MSPRRAAFYLTGKKKGGGGEKRKIIVLVHLFSCQSNHLEMDGLCEATTTPCLLNLHFQGYLHIFFLCNMYNMLSRGTVKGLGKLGTTAFA